MLYDSCAFEFGAVYYENERPMGIVTPFKLGAFLLSKHASLKKERDDAKRALSKALEQKMSYLAHMGHELRAPLNSILGFSDMMREGVYGPLGDQHYDEYVGNIYQAGHHLLDVVNVVLDMAKLRSGFLELHNVRTDLSELCKLSLIHI